MKIVSKIVAISALFVSSSCSAQEVSDGHFRDLPNVKTGDEIDLCEDCPIFVRVPNAPQNLRSIRYVSKYEVTWKNYLKSVDDGACTIPNRNLPDGNNFPLQLERMRVDWPISTLGMKEIDCYLGWLAGESGYQIALPTVEEWDWFARAGTTTLFPWGDQIEPTREALRGNDIPKKFRYPGPYIEDFAHLSGVKVGLFPPNDWGLYDIMGNEMELTASKVSGEEILMASPNSNFARRTRDRESVIIKSNHWYDEEWKKMGVATERTTVIWDGRILANAALRLIIIDGANEK